MSPLCIGSLLVVSLLASNQGRQDTSASDDGLAEGMMVRILIQDSLDAGYLLDELGITDSQQAALATAIERTRRGIIVAHQERNRVSDELESAASREVRDALTRAYYRRDLAAENAAKELVATIQQELLPHQIDRLKQVLFQRYFQSVTGASVFEFPLHVADRLGITAVEKQELQRKTKELKESYEARRKQLELELLGKLMKDVPEDVKPAVIRLVGRKLNQ